MAGGKDLNHGAILRRLTSERMGDTIAAVGGQQADGEQTAASKRDVGRNMGAFAIAQIAVRVIGLAVVVVVARLLTNDDFGRYSVALALSAMLTLPVESGMGGYLVREGTQHPQRLGVVLGHVLSLQTLTGAAALGVAGLLGILLEYDRPTLITLLLLTVATVVVIMTRSLLAVLVSLKQAKDYAAYSSGQALLLAVLTVAAAVAGAGPVGLGIASLLTSAVSAPIAYVLLRRRWHMPIAFQREGMRATFGVSVAYSAAKLGNSLLTYIDAVLVQAIKGNGAAAQYGAAYRFLLALRMFPLIYTDALSQPAAKLARADRAGLADITNRSASQLFILGFPLAIGGYLLGEPLMSAIFGERYAAAGTTASLLLLTLALSFPHQVVVVSALAMGLERRVAMSYGIAVIANVAANAFLIPAYGAEGAALAMVLTTPIFSAYITWQLIRAGIPLRLDARYGKAAMATVAMAAAVLLTGDLPLMTTVGAGAAAYIAVLVGLRTLDRDDLAMLPGGRRLGWLARS